MSALWLHDGKPKSTDVMLELTPAQKARLERVQLLIGLILAGLIIAFSVGLIIGGHHATPVK